MNSARFAEQENHVHSVDNVFHTVFGAGYGVSDDFTVSLKIPYEYLNNIREAHHDEPEEIHNRGDSRGIGDMTILGYYRFLNMPSHDFSLSLLFGLKVPTGITDEEDREGERFETEFQPGTGAWSPMAGIACTKLSREVLAGCRSSLYRSNRGRAGHKHGRHVQL